MRYSANHDIEVRLHLGDSDAIDRAIFERAAVPPLQRRPLTRDYPELDKLKVKWEDVVALRNFANRNGLTLRLERGGMSAVLRGSQTAVENAFNCEVCEYQYVRQDKFGRTESGRYFSHRGAELAVPAALMAFVSSAVMKTNQPTQREPHFEIAAGKAVEGHWPRQLAKARGVSDAAFANGGAGQTIGYVELGGGYDLRNTRAALAAQGFSQADIDAAAANISTLSVDGGTNSYTGDVNSADGEVELDLQLGVAIAPKAKHIVAFAPNTDVGFADAVRALVDAGCTIISISWGQPESETPAADVNQFHAALQYAQLHNVTVNVATGDNGAVDNATSGQPTTDHPAADPLVDGGGGQHRSLNADGSTKFIKVWNDLNRRPRGGATGAGVSQVFAKPAFQNGCNAVHVVSKQAGRIVPDTTGFASPDGGVRVVFTDQKGVQSQPIFGGTSAVAPEISGEDALINNVLNSIKPGTRVGLKNVLEWTQMVAAGCFTPIVTGEGNGPAGDPNQYFATGQPNACQGVGSRQFDKALNFYQKGLNPPSGPSRGKGKKRRPATEFALE